MRDLEDTISNRNEGVLAEVASSQREARFTETIRQITGAIVPGRPTVQGTVTHNDPTLKSLASFPRWVAWKEIIRKPEEEPTKVPFDPKSGGGAKANDPSTWGTRADAERRAVDLGVPGQVGIELGLLDDAHGIGGIDLDTCRDPASGKLDSWAEDIVARFDTYTEVSPSGTGVKVFFRYAAADTLALRSAIQPNSVGDDDKGWGKSFKRGTEQKHPPAIELYLGRRYFTVTGAVLPDAPAELLRRVSASLLLRLIQQDGPAFAGDKRASGGGKSRSEAALRIAGQVMRANGTYEEFVARVTADPATADWVREKGEADNGRELQRTWDRACADAASKGGAIEIVAGQLHDMATQGEAALIEQKRPIYQRGGVLVRPIMQEAEASAGRKTQTASLLELNEPRIVDELSANAAWAKFDGRSKAWVPADPPKLVAQIILSRSGRWSLAPIAGVTTTPTLRPDGTLLSEPGYDKATRLYLFRDDTVRLSGTVHNPTRADAEAALADLNDLIREFPFEGDADRAVALSGLITPVVRGAMSVSPMHGFSANSPGTGKSYYVDLASCIATGRPCPVTSAAADEAETDKRLTGDLLQGRPIISLDNVNGELGGDFLCQAVERPFVNLRPLGTSATREVEVRTTIFATGNKLQLSGDMVRRGLRCDLNAGVERPELRRFDRDPVRSVLEERGRYVSACLIIVRAYIVAGRPGLLPALGSFEGWSDTVRSALVWLGGADPAQTQERSRDDDPVLIELRSVMTTWAQCYGGNEKRCGDIVANIESMQATDTATSDLRNALFVIAARAGRLDVRRLGMWLQSIEDRIVSVDDKECRFKRTGTTGGSARWALQVRHDGQWRPHGPPLM